MNELLFHRVLWIIAGFFMVPPLYGGWICANDMFNICTQPSFNFMKFWLDLIIVLLTVSGTCAYFWALYLLFAPNSDKDEEIEKQLHHDKIVSIDGNTITVEYKEINDGKIY